MVASIQKATVIDIEINRRDSNLRFFVFVLTPTVFSTYGVAQTAPGSKLTVGKKGMKETLSTKMDQ
jgi:hypothetical protein